MIHLVYPHRDRISAPDVIGARLSSALRQLDEVQTHEVDALYKIRPTAGDVLIGHAYPGPTVFSRSVRDPAWSRRILLQPYNGDWQQVGFLDPIVDHCDMFLSITGRYWFDRVEQTHAARWYPKMVHVDLAVDRADFPLLKHDVAPAGRRRVLYIGNDHPGKNLPYLDAIAAQWQGGSIDWAGRGKPMPNLRQLGFVDFASSAGRALIADYDFLLTVGSADANPTSVLEAMSWGLIPICTPTSGYVGESGIINVPGNDVLAVCAQLDRLQYDSNAELSGLRQEGQTRLASHFTWTRFAAQVIDAISSTASPAIRPRAPGSPIGGPRMTLEFAAKLAAKTIANQVDRWIPGTADRLRRAARKTLRA